MSSESETGEVMWHFVTLKHSDSNIIQVVQEQK